MEGRPLKSERLACSVSRFFQVMALAEREVVQQAPSLKIAVSGVGRIDIASEGRFMGLMIEHGIVAEVVAEQNALACRIKISRSSQ